VAHAAVEAAESIRRYCPEWYYSWLDDDSLQTKIILKVDSEAKLQALSRDACCKCKSFSHWGNWRNNHEIYSYA